jgi:hypothetical protein
VEMVKCEYVLQRSLLLYRIDNRQDIYLRREEIDVLHDFLPVGRRCECVSPLLRDSEQLAT